VKLSYTSKMPCPSFALPAGKECPTGSKLMTVDGSVCKSCYARKGYYVYPAAKLLRRTNLYETKKATHSASHRKYWVNKMVELITKGGHAWFRWHDSGDLLSAEHLRMIMEVCERTPDTRHWLPTREYRFVEVVLASASKPKNLTIRLSAHMVGKTLPSELPTSSVGAGVGMLCPATHDPKHDGSCGDCRACWVATVDNVDYKRH
jgi:hypothetical protein